MAKTLYILGAGGHGKVVADAAKKMKQWEEIYFLDDKLVGEEVLGLLVKDRISNAEHYNREYTEYIVALGDNYKRKDFQMNLIKVGCRLATIIHPFSSIGEEVKIGKGTVIFAGVVINSSTIIGEGCIVNTLTSVDHDSYINDFVHLSPGVRIAGNVTVGANSWLGINSTVINNIMINGCCIIGADSLVLKDITTEGIYVGSPVKKLAKGTKRYRI